MFEFICLCGFLIGLTPFAIMLYDKIFFGDSVAPSLIPPHITKMFEEIDKI